MSHRTTRRQIERTIQDLFATARVTGCQSQACPRPPEDLTSEELRRLSLWADDEEVIFLHDGVAGRLYRLPLFRGQAELIHRDIRDEAEVALNGPPKAIVLHDVPRPGPGTGQIHFGIVAWEADDGPDEVQVMVYRRTP